MRSLKEINAELQKACDKISAYRHSTESQAVFLGDMILLISEKMDVVLSRLPDEQE